MRSVKKPQVEAVQALINLKLVAVSESYIYGNICHRLGLMYLQRPKKHRFLLILCPFQPIHGVVLFSSGPEAQRIAAGCNQCGLGDTLPNHPILISPIEALMYNHTCFTIVYIYYR